MRVISKATLRAFWNTVEGRAAEAPLCEWYRTVEKADWQSFADVRAIYASADMVGDCIVFNIGGNKFRLVVKTRFASHKVFIRKVMTHREYDTGKWKNDCNCFAEKRSPQVKAKKGTRRQ